MFWAAQACHFLALGLHCCALNTLRSLWLHRARPGSSSASFGYRIKCFWRLWFLFLDHVLSSCCTLFFSQIFVAAHTYVHRFVLFHLSRSSCQKRTTIPLASSHGGQMRSKLNNQGFNNYLICCWHPIFFQPPSKFVPLVRPTSY